MAYKNAWTRGKQKYNAKKTEIDGILFDSKKEARRYSELKILEKSGIISNLELQPSYELQEKFRDRNGKAIRAINYIADFKYYDNERQEIVVEDVKGMKTDVYNIKKKMFIKKYPEIIFKEI